MELQGLRLLTMNVKLLKQGGSNYTYYPNLFKAGGSNVTYCPDFVGINELSQIGATLSRLSETQLTSTNLSFPKVLTLQLLFSSQI